MVAVLVERDGTVRVVLDLGLATAQREVIEDRGIVFEYESTEVTWDGKWARYYREKGSEK